MKWRTTRSKLIVAALGAGVLGPVAFGSLGSGPVDADSPSYAGAVSAALPLVDGLVADGQAIQDGLSGVTIAPDGVGVDMVVNGTAFWFARWGGFPGALRESEPELVASDRLLLEVALGADTSPIDAAIQTYSCAELSPSCAQLTTFALHDGRNAVTLPEVAPRAIRVALSTPAPRSLRVRRVALLPPGSPETAPSATASFDQPQPGSGPIVTSLSWVAAPRLGFVKLRGLAVTDGGLVRTHTADPGLFLRLPKNGIDPAAYHWLSVEVDDPGLDLRSGRGDMRLHWRISGVNAQQTSADIVSYGGLRRYDLATTPAMGVTDPRQGSPRVGWTGGRVAWLRFDPTEDPAPHNLLLKQLRLDRDAWADDVLPISVRGPAGAVVDLAWEAADGAQGDVANAVAVDAATGLASTRWAIPAGMRGRITIVAIVRVNADGAAFERRIRSTPVDLRPAGVLRPSGPVR